VGITDWISLSGGSLANLGLFAGKKILSSAFAKELVIKKLSKQTTPAIIKASNLSKDGTRSDILRGMSNTGNKSVVKALPSGK